MITVDKQVSFGSWRRVGIGILLCCSVPFSVTCIAQVDKTRDSGLVSILSADGKAGFEKFRATSAPHKAFAICADGAWSWVKDRATPEIALEAALERAKKHTKEAPCHSYAVDDKIADGGPVVLAKPSDARAVLATVELKKSIYWDERNETEVAPTTTANRTLHSPTPSSIPGAKTISTVELVQMLSSPTPPTLVDVRANSTVSIPGSIAANNMGSDFSSKGDLSSKEFLETHIKEKDKSVVFYCLSWQCWLSYNAALRAISLGYSNVSWYRGGFYSWFDAALPIALEP